MREREKERERERETNVDVRNIHLLTPMCAPAQSRTHNLGMCSDLGFNLQPFGVQDDAPTD